MIVSSTFSLFIKPNSWNRYCLFRGIRHGIVPFVGDSGYRYCRGNCHPWLARGLRRRCPTMERRLSWNYWRFRQKKKYFYVWTIITSLREKQKHFYWITLSFSLFRIPFIRTFISGIPIIFIYGSYLSMRYDALRIHWALFQIFPVTLVVVT